jgi:hypothetical protein
MPVDNRVTRTPISGDGDDEEKEDPRVFAVTIPKGKPKPKPVLEFHEHLHRLRHYLQKNGIAYEEKIPVARRSMPVQRACIRIADEHEASRYSSLCSEVVVEKVIEYHNNKIRMSQYQARKAQKRKEQPASDEELVDGNEVRTLVYNLPTFIL